MQNQMRSTQGPYRYNDLRCSDPVSPLTMDVRAATITQKGAVSRAEYHSNLEKYQRLTQAQNEKQTSKNRDLVQLLAD